MKWSLINFFLLISVLLVAPSSQAAYYFDLNGNGKITVSKDQRQAVMILNGKSPVRYKFVNAQVDQVDNFGRPYNLTIYYPESCNVSDEKCSIPALSIKLFTDKQGGFVIWLTESEHGKVLWGENLTTDKLSED